MRRHHRRLHHAAPGILLLLVPPGAACTRDPAATLGGPPAAVLVASPSANAYVIVSPPPEPPPEPEPWRAEFEEAAAGLLYTSEADYPFEYFRLPAPAYDSLTASRFLQLLGADPATPIRQRSYEEFFARHTTRVDPSDAVSVALIPRYEHLEFVLEEALDDRSTFCLGRVFLRCFVAGYTLQGSVVGLATWALET
ncbi:MAG TPA: nuclease A inhibitor family protein [Gemmatimonadaceae bacterium]|nr:nuclease A inhibitor family protein [Gemmatimonadaceae bacterium]